MKLACLVLLLCGSCASTREERGSTRVFARPAGLLPAPSGPLVFPAEPAEVPLDWLVRELARLTGQEIVVAEEDQRELSRRNEVLESREPVPADALYPFVESILLANDFLLAAGPAGPRPILHLSGMAMRGGGPAPRPALAITLEQRAELEHHPALVFQLAMSFQNIDTRQLQTQLRQLLVDVSGAVNCVPAGERSLILVGYGSKLSGLVTLLEEIDRNSAAPARSAQTQAEQAAQPR